MVSCRALHPLFIRYYVFHYGSVCLRAVDKNNVVAGDCVLPFLGDLTLFCGRLRFYSLVQVGYQCICMTPVRMPLNGCFVCSFSFGSLSVCNIRHTPDMLLSLTERWRSMALHKSDATSTSLVANLDAKNRPDGTTVRVCCQLFITEGEG